MRNGRALPSNKTIGVHVIDPSPLSAFALRAILRKDFPTATFHSKLPPSLPRNGAPVFVVNPGTIEPIAEVLRATRLRYLQASVIILLDRRVASESAGELIELISMGGAAGFVPHERAEQELPDAIRSVAHGRVWISAELARRFEQSHTLQKARWMRHPRTDRALLTARETAVLVLLEQKLCNKEIASALEISVPTVKFHVKNLYAKTGVRDRLSAIEWARQQPASVATRLPIGDAAAQKWRGEIARLQPEDGAGGQNRSLKRSAMR
ncbi:MAG: response regulator transcription factor [Terriglobia bacterium]